MTNVTAREKKATGARKSAGVALLVLAGSAAAAALAYGAARWKARTRELRDRLEAERADAGPGVFDSAEIGGEGLPDPVRRYSRAVLTPGQPMVAAADIAHEGRFSTNDAGPPQWRPFTSTQRVIMRRAGFDWNARIQMAPGLSVLVHDAYVAGEGVLHAELMGLVAVADMRGTPEIARGELLRFLAEAVWYPTRLLPGQGVRWEAIDDATARVTLADDGVEVSLDFRFDEDGLVRSVYAPARHRTVRGGALVETPWEGWFGAYAWRGGMRIPLVGEVAWVLPEGRRSYWRGRVTRVVYEFAR